MAELTQLTEKSLVASCKAGGAITAGAVVVFDTSTAGEVDLPAAAKCDKIAGVALTDAASGDMIAVIKSGIVKCNAGGTIAIGDYVEVGSTAGKVTAIPATEAIARTAHALGIATSAGVDEGNVLVEIRMQDKAVAATQAGS